MATDRQLAANRHNARKSTGPRSRGGKQRAARNAYRHGLCLSVSSIPAVAPEVERLARDIAGDSNHETKLQVARAVAQAQLDLERVRRTKVGLLRRVSVLGALDSEPKLKREEPAATMPAQEPERSAEAIRRALPELMKLDRYERRAARRLDHAAQLIRAINVSSDL